MPEHTARSSNDEVRQAINTPTRAKVIDHLEAVLELWHAPRALAVHGDVMAYIAALEAAGDALAELSACWCECLCGAVADDACICTDLCALCCWQEVRDA